MKLEIVRGLPGAGKSTHARNNKNDSFVVETDQFFIIDQEYKWDYRFIGVAHNWCLAKVVMLLRHERNVIVANTFITVKEMASYIDLQTYFPDLEIVITELYTMHGSIHNVPAASIDKMAKRWENVPTAWVEDGRVVVNRVE